MLTERDVRKPDEHREWPAKGRSVSKARLICFLGKIPWVSHVVRWRASQYKDGTVVTIRTGLAQGMRWRRYHRYVNGYWIGQYEWPIQQAMRREPEKGHVLYDLGANAGFLSLVGCCLVGNSGCVVSFDPDPDNCESMRQQIELNGLDNWIVVKRAVSSEPGRLAFARTKPGALTGHIGDPTEDEEVIGAEVMTLDMALESFPCPQFIKMDVEGAEVRVLQGATRMISEVRPVWLVELHGREYAEEVAGILAKAEYSLFSIDGTHISHKDTLPPHIIARPNC